MNQQDALFSINLFQ